MSFARTVAAACFTLSLSLVLSLPCVALDNVPIELDEWQEYACPDSGCNNYHEDGWGVMNVKNDPPNPDIWRGNHTHLRYVAGPEGVLGASAVIGFTGDNGHTGWFKKTTGGPYGPDESCLGLEHAPRASDELLVLTLLDTGEEWYGVYWGGDELPLGIAIDASSRVPLEQLNGFSVAGILRQDVNGRRVLARTILPPVEMGARDLRLLGELRQNPDRTWIVRASGSRPGGLTWNIEAPLFESPVLSGKFGIIAAGNAAPYCIYNPHNYPCKSCMFDRQFVVHDSVLLWSLE